MLRHRELAWRRARENGFALRGNTENNDANDQAQQHGADAAADAKQNAAALFLFGQLFFSASLGHDLPPFAQWAN